MVVAHVRVTRRAKSGTTRSTNRTSGERFEPSSNANDANAMSVRHGGDGSGDGDSAGTGGQEASDSTDSTNSEADDGWGSQIVDDGT